MELEWRLGGYEYLLFLQEDQVQVQALMSDASQSSVTPAGVDPMCPSGLS